MYPATSAAVRPRLSQPPLRFPWNDVAGPILLLIAHLPLLAAYARQLWLLPHYQFFVFVPLGVAALLSMRRAEFAERSAPSETGFVVAFAVNLLLLAFAVWANSAWLGMASFLATLVVAAYGVGGIAWIRALAPAWLLLAVLLRLPQNYDFALIDQMQWITARWASRALDFLGVVHVLQGNGIVLATRRLLVEEACSGVRSLFSAIAAVLFMVLWTRQSRKSALVLMASVPVFVLLANAARVTAVAVLVGRYGIDADKGLLHEALSLLSFVGVLGLVGSLRQLLHSASLVRPTVEPEGEAPAARPPSSRPRSVAVGIAWAPVAFAVAGVAVLAAQGLASTTGLRPAVAFSGAPIRLENAVETTMPAKFDEMQRTTFKSGKLDAFGIERVASHVWYYRGPRESAAVAADFPFNAWHELPNCYRNEGWVLEDRRVASAADRAGNAIPFVECSFQRPGHDRRGLLCFALMDARGEFATPDPTVGEALQKLFARVRKPEPAGPFVQVQAFVETSQDPTPEDRRRVGAMLVEACERVHQLQRSAGGRPQ